MSYREMRTLSNKVAHLLRSLGVRKGDRVAGILPRVPVHESVPNTTWLVDTSRRQSKAGSFPFFPLSAAEEVLTVRKPF